MITSVNAQSSDRNPGQGGFSLSNLLSANKEIPDSLLAGDSIITTGNITGYHLSSLLGEPYVAPMDTNWRNFSNSTLVEGRSIGVGFLANVGSASQSRIFSERKEMRDFIFADAFDYWITTPENAYFYDTKIPYTNVLYTTDFAGEKKSDRIKGVLTTNFGKRINVGAEADYNYSRGFYASNGNKLVSYRLFGSYTSDRYEAKAQLGNYHFVYHENGGLTEDRYITDPEHPDLGGADKQSLDSRYFTVRYSDYFNRVRGKFYHLSHRYNLGFYRSTGELDEEGYEVENFIPVSSIIHTVSYEDNRRHAYVLGDNTSTIDASYPVCYRPDTTSLNDRSSYWKLTNTIGLSLREGFQNWAKFGLTAFINFEKRQYKLPKFYDERTDDEIIYLPEMPTLINYEAMDKYDEFSTYIGAELSKRKGSILTYNARGELGVVGDDIGEFRISGELQTRFKLFKKDAAIRAEAYIHNVTPAFYVRHNSSRYYQWNNPNMKKERKVYAGGTVDIESTKTRISAGVNNVGNYVFFNSSGNPEQYNGNIQVLTARLKQDFRYQAFGWENEVVYQLSGQKDVLPLPEVTAYSNLYVEFKPVPVLTVQLGADVHFHTSYYAPYYEPATLQFQLQDENSRVRVGDYPLINAYANFHLKQARFFIMAYNLGTNFVKPNYFSLPHYPLDPMVIKAGIAVVFNN